jgi:hypothetical protein
VSAAKIKRNTLGRTEIRESRLGQVPDAAQLGGLAPGSFLRSTGTAVDSAKVGGLTPSAFEPRAQRFEIADPSPSLADAGHVTIGPFTLSPACRDSGEGVTVSSSEEHAALGGAVGSSNANAYATTDPDLGASPYEFLFISGSSRRLVPFVLWVAAPSGYRLLVNGWVGRGLFGKPCTVLGGVAVKG